MCPCFSTRGELCAPSAIFSAASLAAAVVLFARELVFPRPLKPRSFKIRSKPESLRGLRVLEERGSALVEFAIVLPLLVVFVVGIFDFSGAFNQTQKIEQAAQEGAIIAGAQPMTDIAPSGSSIPSNPDSLQPVVTAIVNSLAGSGVLSQGACPPPFPASAQASLTWTFTITGCSSAYPNDPLVITINRGLVVVTAGPTVVGTTVTVQYPYHWRFNSVIQLLFPGPSNLPATITERATVHNQM